MNPFCVPFATTNMGSAILAMELVSWQLVLLLEIQGGLMAYNKAEFKVLPLYKLQKFQGWMGPNYSLSSACATGNFCILNAAYHIKRGDAVSSLSSHAGINTSCT